tara:strand:+ start:569 stop:943 length:375 start_codon:yes stop_codon:yes gene_type:complete
MEKIIVYTNDNCSYCKEIKEELTKREIEFENRLTSDFTKEWQDITSLVAMAQVPTVIYKNNYFTPGRDFGNPAHLLNILKNFEESSFSLEKQTFEKLKTFTYHMHTAFSKLDRVLNKIENKLNP